MPISVGVLASGEGTTLRAVMEACAAGCIQGRVSVVISNNSRSGALRRANAAGIPAHHLSSVTHPAPPALDAAITAVLVDGRVDVVLLAGYMKRLGPDTLAVFRGRVLNTYPALLPRFGGVGMFGDQVFRAVLASGDAESGVSLHLVDEHYDTGPLVRQPRVPIETGDSVASLKVRTLACERELVVQTLAAIAVGELQLIPDADLTGQFVVVDDGGL